MSYTQPVAADLVARFPTFSAVASAAIAAAITEAAARVDTTWTAGDYPMGVMLYAAHLMTLDGLGTSAEAALGAAGALGFGVLRSGNLSLDRRDTAGPDRGNLLAETTYGRRFLALLRVNQPGVLVP